MYCSSMVLSVTLISFYNNTVFFSHAGWYKTLYLIVLENNCYVVVVCMIEYNEYCDTEESLSDGQTHTVSQLAAVISDQSESHRSAVASEQWDTQLGRGCWLTTDPRLFSNVYVC